MYAMSIIPSDNRILFYHRDRQSFGFLSNFHVSPIVVDGETWPSSEHYYQAQKSLQSEYRDQLRAAYSPGHAKRLAADPALPRKRSGQSWFRRNGVSIRADWQEVKLQVMRNAVRAKFSQNSELSQRLLATGAAELLEDSESDSYWGSGNKDEGLNWLGRVLMEVRAELKIHSLPSTGGRIVVGES